MSKLEEMLKYVSEHNEFYKNRIKEYGIKDPLDITQWPILTRKELQENRYNMFSDGYKSKYFNQQLRRQSSSGSSGVPVNVYWDYKDWYASNLSLWRKRLQWYGIKPNDRCVVFINSFNNKLGNKAVYYINEPSNILSVNISLMQTDEQYRALIEIINEFEPVWLYVQPFILSKLVYLYKKYGINKPTSLRYIESVGELLPSDVRRSATDLFKVELANMYGSEEMSGIAYECPVHHLHVLDENVVVEVKNECGIHLIGEGETIITNLNNKAMPSVRYNQGDYIRIKELKSPCLCGYCSTEIEVIKGRALDVIKLRDGFELNSLMLLEIMAKINNEFSDIILNYRYVYYKSTNSLICCIALDDEKSKWYGVVKKEIEKSFTKLNLSDKIRFEIVLDKKHDETRKRTIVQIES